MANRIKFSVSCTPIETLTDANAETHDIVASEVGKSLGGSGDSVTINAYNGTAANQGYLNKTVNYKTASHSAGGTELTATLPDFILIKNTGYKFSDATTLGASTSDCVMVVLKIVGWDTGVSGGWATSAGVTADHYHCLGWLKPGQAMLFPLSDDIRSTVTQFGSSPNDIGYFEVTGGAMGNTQIFARTFQSDGSAAASGNAIEYLIVT